MASIRSGATLYSAASLFNGESVVGMSEPSLLERFAARRDEAAFAALVSLHGPMVMATCRAMLHDSNDVEDAFQATFLVLVKKAGGLRITDSVGGWLYRVAFRMALQAKDDAARRRDRERRAGEEWAARRSAGRASDEVIPRLYAEIDRLPERYRVPLVLCYLQGVTQDLAAQRLGLSEGTLRRRLAQARERLRARLTRRGGSQTAGSLCVLLARQRATIPVGWADAAVRLAVSDAAEKTVPLAAAWAKAGLKAMHAASLKQAGLLVLAVVTSAAGLGLCAGFIRDAHPGRLSLADRARGAFESRTSAAVTRRGRPALDGPLAPRGRRIYVSGTSRFSEVAPTEQWVSLAVDADQGGARRQRSVEARASIWRSSDGAILAWSGIGKTDNSLWARDAQGKDNRLVDARDLGTSCAGMLCAFAPDGKRLVFATLELRQGLRAFTTWRMNMDGTARVRLPLTSSEMVADWSPDGERLLVVSEGGPASVRSRRADELSLATPDGKRARLLMKGRMFIHPRFSPDGLNIAYAGHASPDGEHALIIVGVDKSNPRRVMDLRGVVSDQICWSPDGKQLALSRLTREGEATGPQASVVEIVNADGTNRRRLQLPVEFTAISELNWR